MKQREVQAVSAAQARCDYMKKTINILSIADLSVIALWAIALVISRLTAETSFASTIAAVFVVIYAVAIVFVAAYTIASIVLFIKKKKYSLPLVFFTYVINIAWVAIIFMVVDYAKEFISKLG